MNAAKILIPCVVCLLAAFLGYGHGFSVAKAKGAAALEAERADREREESKRALAVAGAEKTAREKLENAMHHAQDLEQRLLQAESAHAKERAEFNRRISNVAKIADATCTSLPVEWVREYNAALGTSDSPVPINACSAPVDGRSGSLLPPVSGLLPGQSLTSPADILAHARDYGTQCQRLKRQVLGWQETYHTWEGKVR